MLQACDISFSYDGKEPVYQGFSLSVSPGDRLFLNAPSGFGKTTLCRLLANYEQPDSGKILVDGQPFPRKGPCPVQLIGQHPELAVDPRRRMEATLREAGALDPGLMERLGIRDRWLSRYPRELSGGELQRFCIARALMANPCYLVADEISTMLDALTQAQVWDVLMEEVRSRNLGLVFTTHSPSLARRLATREVDLTAVV